MEVLLEKLCFPSGFSLTTNASCPPLLSPFPPQDLCRIIHSPFVKTFAFRRLELLQARFQLHKQLNAEKVRETTSIRVVSA